MALSELNILGRAIPGRLMPFVPDGSFETGTSKNAFAREVRKLKASRPLIEQAVAAEIGTGEPNQNLAAEVYIAWRISPVGTNCPKGVIKTVFGLNTEREVRMLIDKGEEEPEELIERIYTKYLELKLGRDLIRRFSDMIKAGIPMKIVQKELRLGPDKYEEIETVAFTRDPSLKEILRARSPEGQGKITRAEREYLRSQIISLKKRRLIGEKNCLKAWDK